MTSHEHWMQIMKESPKLKLSFISHPSLLIQYFAYTNAGDGRTRRNARNCHDRIALAGVVIVLKGGSVLLR